MRQTERMVANLMLLIAGVFALVGSIFALNAAVSGLWQFWAAAAGFGVAAAAVVAFAIRLRRNGSRLFDARNAGFAALAVVAIVAAALAMSTLP